MALCSLFGHKYSITKKITNFVNEYKCACCYQEVSEGSNGKLELLTKKNREINQCLRNFFQKRNQRLNTSRL